MVLEDVVLNGSLVSLEPLTAAAVDDLLPVALEPELWRWTPGVVADRAGLERYVAEALEERARGSSLPFLIRWTGSSSGKRAAGCTRFGAISLEHRRAEIGWTWLGSEFWGTGANVETKLLMLSHAFETWRCLRVELKTDALNQRSRRAIEALGAKPEGIFRKHILTSSGRVRDTAWYSITDDEWPQVAARLRNRLSGKL